MDINGITKKYLTQGTLLALLLYIIGIGIGAAMKMQMALPLTISFVFTLLTVAVYGLCWRLVAKASPRSLTMFYMAGIGLRMCLAMPFIVGYWAYADTFQETLTFVIVFIIFYLAMLAFDAIYFVRIEKQQKTFNK